MKKFAFTLQEALITVGIIGIIAAITVPAAVKIMPDQLQTKYLKTYTALKDLTCQMLVDSTLYWHNSDNIACDGLSCAEKPTDGSVPAALLNIIPQDADFVQKYAAIVSYYMHSNDFEPNNPDGTTTFNTQNGVHWSFIESVDGNIIVTVDLNTGNGRTTAYENGNSINDTDTFKFDVYTDGTVRPSDAYGIALINNPTLVNSKKKITEYLGNNADGQTSVSLRPKNTTNDNWWSNDALCTNYPSMCSSSNYNTTSELGESGHSALFAPRGNQSETPTP